MAEPSPALRHLQRAPAQKDASMGGLSFHFAQACGYQFGSMAASNRNQHVKRERPLGYLVALLAAGLMLVQCKGSSCGRVSPAQVPTPAPGADSASAPVQSALAGANPTTAAGSEEPPFPGMRTLRRKFALADTEILLRDVHMSRDFAKLLNDEHADLVINGGFFDTHDAPLGFAMSEGHVLSAPRSALSGGVLLIDSGTATLVASEDFTRPAQPSGFAIQCRPRLVVRSHVNVRSDDGKRAERTALCISDQAHSLEVIIVRGSALGDGPSLLDLARYLQSSKCEEALSLDGGPSTGYAMLAPEPKPQATAASAADLGPTAPRGAVRHAIVFRQKR